MATEPSFSSETSGDELHLKLAGRWTVDTPDVERRANDVAAAGSAARHITLDIGGVEAMDTAGAWLIDRSRARLSRDGVETQLTGARQEFDILLKEAHFRSFEENPKPRLFFIVTLLAQVGRDVVVGARDLFNGVAFLGQLVAALARILAKPRRMRPKSIVHHIEAMAYQGVPIIALINFIVGCIVAQQGLYQLQRFGAPSFAIDLVGILTLRELGVLLTSIMLAGRTGSAITAELGSMKMREEIDALRVMGLETTEVLVMPRVLGLIVSLPLLTFIADIAALIGGGLTCWIYGGINPQAYMQLLKEAIGIHTFLVGFIKAPFMALVIAITATLEGMAVQGSAESLGRHVTASVVKAIFMIIVIDGFFAVFFAGLRY